MLEKMFIANKIQKLEEENERFKALNEQLSHFNSPKIESLEKEKLELAEIIINLKAENKMLKAQLQNRDKASRDDKQADHETGEWVSFPEAPNKTVVNEIEEIWEKIQKIEKWIEIQEKQVQMVDKCDCVVGGQYNTECKKCINGKIKNIQPQTERKPHICKHCYNHYE